VSWRIEETQGGVARPGVGPSRPEVEHRSTRPGPAGLNHPAPRLPESPGDPSLPSSRPRLPPKEHAGPTRPHVGLDDEPGPAAPHELRQVDSAPGWVLGQTRHEDAGPRHGPAQEAMLGRREEGRQFGPAENLEKPLMAELPRHARKDRARIEAVEEGVERPDRGGPEILEAQIAIDDVDRHVPKPHTASTTPELGGDPVLGGDPSPAEGGH
jgi:hypothetical protein